MLKRKEAIEKKEISAHFYLHSNGESRQKTYIYRQMVNACMLGEPHWLFLLLLWPLWLGWPWRPYRPGAALSWPGTDHLGPTWRTRCMAALPWLMWGAFACLTVALARPQQHRSAPPAPGAGIDIGLVIDVSESMLAEDFKPNRLEAAKQAAMAFVQQRTQDRISLTVFAGEAYSPCPLTTDHSILLTYLAGVQHGLLRDNTAIGDGLATALNRLRDTTIKSRIVVLLTDGAHNAGLIEPLLAAEMARSMGVRVYTIDIGSRDTLQADGGNLLKRMAQMTGGRYFQADTPDVLERVYDAIDRLERSPVKPTEPMQHQEDVYHAWIWVALVCVAIYFLLRYLLWHTVP